MVLDSTSGVIQGRVGSVCGFSRSYTLRYHHRDTLSKCDISI